MHLPLRHCSLVAAQVLAGVLALPALGQDPSALKARCTELISFYDRYGVGRSANSDGRRNHTRIGAEFDCARGNAAQGVAIMEDLLKRKAFDLPPSGQTYAPPEVMP